MLFRSLAIGCLSDFSAGAGAAGEDVDQDGLTLRGPVAIVQVEEAAAQALEEDGGRAKSEGAVAADRESIGEDGSGLGWLVELELEVGRNVPGATVLIRELAVGQSDDEGS